MAMPLSRSSDKLTMPRRSTLRSQATKVELIRFDGQVGCVDHAT
jgi:hypothetical protein